MDIVEEMRGFESDHEPDGWPAIQMKQVSALCDEIDVLRAELQQLREQEPVIQIENDRVINFNPNYDGDVSNGEFYAAPVPAMPIPKQEPAVAVHELKDIEVTDQMASAFNQAICDDAMNDQDIEEVKTGLRAAISHLHPMPKSFYELEIDRLVAINDSLLANERRLIERLRTMQSSPRITEQDAREIFNSILENQELDFDYWINNCDGRTILNKLNANAVPSQAAAIPEQWREMVADLANELESEVMAKYTLETLKYPSQKNKFDADMDSVHRARALISASPNPE